MSHVGVDVSGGLPGVAGLRRHTVVATPDGKDPAPVGKGQVALWALDRAVSRNHRLLAEARAFNPKTQAMSLFLAMRGFRHQIVAEYRRILLKELPG